MEPTSAKCTICQKLSALRMSRQYTEVYVAAQLNMSQGAYSQLEKHGKGLSIERLVKLAAFYGIEVAEFFSKELLDPTDHGPCDRKMQELSRRIEGLEADLRRLEARGGAIDRVTYVKPLESPLGFMAASFL